MTTTLRYSTLFLALAAQTAGADFYDDLAYYHAPIHYQDTDSSDYRAEYITAIDYDNDWVSTNNWDNLSDGLWPATVYYSVSESCSHYFIVYAFFHPRDWSDNIFDSEHENDLEGALFAVRKNGASYGNLEAMVTVFHTNFYSYVSPGSSLTNGHEDIDGEIAFTDYDGSPRARTAQEAKGHGIKAWPHIPNFNGANNQDGVIYYPTRGAAEYPESGNDRSVKYRLVDIHQANGLWTQALNEADSAGGGADTFNSWGTFRGDTSGGCGSGLKSCSTNSANTPWGWDDGDDDGSYRGEFALDPIHLIDHYFDGLGTFSQVYIAHPYLEDLRAAGYSSAHRPTGFPSQLDLNSLYGKLTNSCQ